jgi:hypothetical protein
MVDDNLVKVPQHPSEGVDCEKEEPTITIA